MRAFGFAFLCLCLLLTGGVSTDVQAQSDAGAVLLPPAPIPQSRSRQTIPRASFGAPNPLPRPVMDDQGTPVRPPDPAPSSEPVPEADQDPDSDHDSDSGSRITATDATLADSPTVPNPAVPSPVVLTLATPTPAPIPTAAPLRNLIPPNPMPRSDFANSVRSISEDSDEPSDREEEGAIPSPPTDPAPEPIIDLACHQTLSALGAMFEPRGHVEGSGQCGIDDAVALHAIGAINLQPAALISCPTAATFTAFVQQTITPQALQTMGSEPSTIYVAASYACRGRNNVPGARMSEHAFGRAVDVRAIELEDGQSWSVRPRATDSREPAARLQAALRTEACGPFNTVLGPGSDGHHTDHIHFDNARRSSTYCR